MSLKLSSKQMRRYNARQLKRWHQKRSAVLSEANAMASTNVVNIDLSNLQSVDDFYERLQNQVQLPEYSAKNLDALHDVLQGDVSESIVFIWPTVTEDIQTVGEILESLKGMLEDLSETRQDMSISYRDYSS